MRPIVVETTESRDTVDMDEATEIGRIADALLAYGAYTERGELHMTGARLPAMLYDAGLRSTSRDSEVREAIEALRAAMIATGGWSATDADTDLAFINDRAAILDRSSTGIVQSQPEAALDAAWETVERSLPKGSPEWEALIHAAVLVGRHPASEAAT